MAPIDDLPLRRRPVPAWGLALALLAGPAWAQAPQDLVHTVQPGESLYELARRYLEDPAQWPRLQSLNQVQNPRRLMPGRQLVIPGALLRTPAASARVVHVAGQAHVQEAGSPTPSALVPDQLVPEAAVIEVGEGGFVTLSLADGSIVRLAAGTRARLSELRHAPDAGHTQSRIELERGRVDVTVTPLRTPRSRFEVRTRRAVGGVRGTTFGVARNDQADFIGDVQEGMIEVTPLEPGAGTSILAQVRAGEGMRLDAGGVSLRRQIGPPDLSSLPSVIEEIAALELRLPEAPEVSAWQVRIANDPAFRQVVRNATFPQAAARFDGLEDGRYHLSVRPIDRHGIPGGEATRELVVNARPQAPLLREPRQGSQVRSSDVSLACTENPDAVGYRFQLARDASFAAPVAQTDADQPTCQYTVRALPPGQYHWRVAAVARDAQGGRDQGPYSQPVAFTVAEPPPRPDVLTWRTETGALHLAWQASAGGPWRYQIQIARDSGFSQLVDDRLRDQPSFTRELPAPGLYHVRVRQIDAAKGLEGPWTDTQHLEIKGSSVTTSDSQPLTSPDGQPVRPGAR